MYIKTNFFNSLFFIVATTSPSFATTGFSNEVFVSGKWKCVRHEFFFAKEGECIINEFLVHDDDENLARVFKMAGLSTATLYKVIDADNKNNLSKLQAGSKIELFITDISNLEKVVLSHNGKLIASFSRVTNNNTSAYVSNIKDSDETSSLHDDNNENLKINKFLANNPKAKSTLFEPKSVSKCIAGNIVSAAMINKKQENEKLIKITEKIFWLATTIQGGNSKVIINNIANSYVNFYTYNESSLIRDLKENECGNLNISVWNAWLRSHTKS